MPFLLGQAQYSATSGNVAGLTDMDARKRAEYDKDFPPLDGLPFAEGSHATGEWLHDALCARFANETEAWATERVGRVMERLNTMRERCPEPGACPAPLGAEILWLGEVNAFAAPGRWVYITRELLQEFTDDAPVAFVLAHEMAHHDLGHLWGTAPAVAPLRHIPGVVAAALVVDMCAHLLKRPAQEAAADRYALHLCVAAGYDARLCFAVFEVMERHALNQRDINGVFGEEASEYGAFAPLRRVWERHQRPHGSLRERRAVLDAVVRRDYPRFARA